MMRRNLFFVLAVCMVFVISCAAPKIRIFPSEQEPLKEFTLEGIGEEKVLVIPIRGIISDAPQERLVRTYPSMVQEFVSQLKLAEKDEDVRAVLIKIESPGGSVTASDILYNEIAAFKQKTQTKVVVAMMGVAASGGYYLSLPADYIVAHPTTITGSIGVVLFRPKLTGLMEKIGVEVEISKSGKNKDMGSPFRPTEAEEEDILQDLTDRLGKRFVGLVEKHRKIPAQNLDEISSGRIYLADEAFALGLIDEVGYLDGALDKARQLANLPADAKVVVYRRSDYPDDNLYNSATLRTEGRGLSLFSFDLPAAMTELHSGFYYLWLPLALGE